VHEIDLWTVLRGLAVVALLAGGAVRQCAAQEAVTEPTVVSVRIVREDGTVLKDGPEGLPVQTGKPVDRGHVAASLAKPLQERRLCEFAGRNDTGRRRSAAGLHCGRKSLLQSGDSARARGAAERGVGCGGDADSIGDVYRKEKLDAAVLRLRDILQEEGLYQAKVTTEVQANAETHQIDGIVHVTPGARARVSAVQLTNNTEYPDAQIAARLKMKTGTAITNARIQKGTAKIRKFLARKGHLSGRAAVRRGEYDAAKNSVPLTLDVTEGPRVRVDVKGAKFSGGDLRRLLPIYQEGAVDVDLLEEGRKNLRERLERQGYFDATVDYDSTTQDVKEKEKRLAGTEEVITYTVSRGDRHKLIGIDISGTSISRGIATGRLTVYQGALGFARKIQPAAGGSRVASGYPSL